MKKFLKYFFITLLVLVAGVIGAGYYFLSTFDLNKYKGQITQIVEEQIGRKLVINGDASVGVSLVPTIVIEGIELENASWASNPTMASIERIELKFSILPLLKKQIVIDKIAIVAPKVFLEVSKEGKANWDFSKPETAKSSEQVAEDIKTVQNSSMDADVLKENPQYALLAGFAAKNVSISDGYVEYRDGKADKITKADIKSVNLSAAGGDQPIKLNFDVTLDANNIVGNVTAGSLDALLNETIYPVDVALKAFGVNLNVKGDLKNVMKDISFILNLDVYNPSGNFGAPETTLKSKVDGDLKVINVDLSSLDVAKNIIVGKIKADLTGKLPMITANLSSDKIDVTTLVPPAKTAFVMPDLIASAHATTLVPNDKVPYDALKSVNADVTLDVARLVVQQGLEATNVGMRAVLNNGDLKVGPFSLNLGEGNVNGSLGVNANSRQVAVKLVTNGLVIQDLVPDFKTASGGKFAIKEGGNFDLDVNILTVGETYRQLVQNMNGQAIVIADKSRIQTGEIKFLQLPFLKQVIDTLQLSKLVKGDLEMTCAVVRADMKGGKVNLPNGIALQATQLNLVGDGSINLMNDNIDFGIQPVAGKIDTSSIATAIGSFVRVKGTIQEPRIGLDEKQALKTAAGVALGGPIAIGGAVLVSNNSAPCYTALEGTAHSARFPKPEGVTATTQDVYKDTKQAVKDTLKDTKQNLKDLQSTTKDDLNNLKDAGKNLLKGFGVK